MRALAAYFRYLLLGILQSLHNSLWSWFCAKIFWKGCDCHQSWGKPPNNSTRYKIISHLDNRFCTEIFSAIIIYAIHSDTSSGWKIPDYNLEHKCNYTLTGHQFIQCIENITFTTEDVLLGYCKGNGFEKHNGFHSLWIDYDNEEELIKVNSSFDEFGGIIDN